MMRVIVCNWNVGSLNQDKFKLKNVPFLPLLFHLLDIKPLLSLDIASLAIYITRGLFGLLVKSYRLFPEPDVCFGFESSSPLPFATCPSMLDSPHVHFPPTPTLTSTEITHSPFIYDRAPIIVTPNTCALPRRGDRKLFGGGNSPCLSPNAAKGGYFHPRAFEADKREPESLLLSTDSGTCSRRRKATRDHQHDIYHALIPPPLVFDHSSESDSDMCGSPPALSVSSIPHISVHFAPRNNSTAPAGPRSNAYPSTLLSHAQSPYSQQDSLGRLDGALSFLSYPTSPMKANLPSKKEEGGFGKRRRSSADRIPGEDGLCRARTRKVVDSCNLFYEPGLEGCLGGF
ncbi:hypothetical protein B0H34DRAFT_3957 [Crassisporium funariophilum]|nr:hypothetical protein B0H34DRAFT_3957 [Crassisporium funariophilum]